jgi:hypothetical protein
VDNQFKPLNSGEVLSVNKSAQFIIGHSTFRVQEFMTAIREQLISHGFGSVSGDKAQWFSEEGIECEVLQFGSDGWQKGKVRLYLEFSPDEHNTSTSGINRQNTTSQKSSQNFSNSLDEEVIAHTEATATANAAIGIAQEEDHFSLNDDFDPHSETHLGNVNIEDDFAEDSLDFDDSSPELNSDDGFDDDLGSDAFGEDFGIGEDDFPSSGNTEGEGLGIGDVFGSDDDALDLNLGDDESMDDVWGEMEDL